MITNYPWLEDKMRDESGEIKFDEKIILYEICPSMSDSIMWWGAEYWVERTLGLRSAYPIKVNEPQIVNNSLRKAIEEDPEILSEIKAECERTFAEVREYVNSTADQRSAKDQKYLNELIDKNEKKLDENVFGFLGEDVYERIKWEESNKASDDKNVKEHQIKEHQNMKQERNKE